MNKSLITIRVTKIQIFVFFGFFLFAFLSTCIATEKTTLKKLEIGFIYNVIPDVEPSDAKIALNLLTEEIQKQLDNSVELNTKFFNNRELLKQGIKNSEIDLVGLTSIDFLEWQNELTLKPFIIGLKNNSPKAGYFLLVHKNSPYQTLESLANKNIIIQDIQSPNSAAYIWFQTLLAKKNYKKSALSFIKHEFEINASKVILPVFFNQAAACITNEHSYRVMCDMNPQIKQNLRVLASSPKLLLGFLCATERLSKQHYSIILDHLINLERYPKSSIFFLIYHFDKLALYKPEHLKETEELYQEFEQFNYE